MVDYDINPPWVEGVRILAFELSRQLVKEGHSVHIVTSATPTSALEEEINGVFFHRISKKAFVFFLARKVRNLHKFYGFNVIHIQNSIILKSFMVALERLRKLVRIPMITYVCLQPTTSPRDFIQLLKLDVTEFLMREALSMRHLTGMLTPSFYTRKEFNMVNKIITSSNYLKTTITNQGVEPNKIDTIYPFINVEEFVRASASNYDYRENMEINKDTPLMLYVGASEADRLGSFLKALPIVLKEIPDSKVVFVSSFTKRFLHHLTKLGLQHAFIPVPMHVKINMPRLMATSNVYVYPGFTAFASIDPPLTLIEAAALGVPIVTSNTGGIPEVIQSGKNSVLFRPFDYRKMADALIKFLGKENIRSCSRRKTASLVNSEFDSRIATRRFVSNYESII